MDEGLRDVREHVLPLLKQQEGFEGFIALGIRPSPGRAGARESVSSRLMKR